MKKQQTVLVAKVTEQTGKAKIGKRKTIELSGKATLTSSRPKVYNIVVWYSNNKCKTTSGDVWEVAICNTQEADYRAIR